MLLVSVCGSASSACWEGRVGHVNVGLIGRYLVCVVTVFGLVHCWVHAA